MKKSTTTNTTTFDETRSPIIRPSNINIINNNSRSSSSSSNSLNVSSHSDDVDVPPPPPPPPFNAAVQGKLPKYDQFREFSENGRSEVDWRSEERWREIVDLHISIDNNDDLLNFYRTEAHRAGFNDSFMKDETLRASILEALKRQIEIVQTDDDTTTTSIADSRILRWLCVIARKVAYSSAESGWPRDALFELFDAWFKHLRLTVGAVRNVRRRVRFRTNNRNHRRRVSRRNRRSNYVKHQRLFMTNRRALADEIFGPKSDDVEVETPPSSVDEQVDLDNHRLIDYWEATFTVPSAPIKGPFLPWKQSSLHPAYVSSTSMMLRDETRMSRLRELWRPIEVEEISLGRRNHRNAAAGPDGIRFQQWTRLVPPIFRAILYNAFLYLEGLPRKEVNVSRTVLLPKKNGATLPQDYRPISVMPIAVRELASLMVSRFGQIDDLLYSRESRQLANRPKIDGCAVATSVMELVMQQQKEAKRSFSIALMDVRKAFDSVSHMAVLDTCVSLGLPWPLVRFLEDLYSNGTTTIATGTTSSSSIIVSRGVRQGDPLSPVLFGLVIERAVRLAMARRHDREDSLWKQKHLMRLKPTLTPRSLPIDGIPVLVTNVTNENTTDDRVPYLLVLDVMAYADDLTVFSVDSDGLRRNILRLETSLERFGLQFNYEKSMALIYGRTQRRQNEQGRGGGGGGGGHLSVQSTTPLALDDDDDNKQIKTIANGEHWRLLGTTFAAPGGPVHFDARWLTNRLDRLFDGRYASLTSTQKLILYKQHLQARLLPRILSSRDAIHGRATLQALDSAIRTRIRTSICRTPKLPNVFIHCNPIDGGLGVISLNVAVPHLAYRKLSAASSVPEIGRYAFYLCDDYLRLAQQKLRRIESNAIRRTDASHDVEIGHRMAHRDHWLDVLLNGDLSHALDNLAVREFRVNAKINNGWLCAVGMTKINTNNNNTTHRSSSYSSYNIFTPKEWYQMLRVRTGRLPTRGLHLPVAGLPIAPCRSGCGQYESGWHVVQMCPLMHDARVQRHNALRDFVAQSIRRQGWQVITEHRFLTLGRSYQPDIVAFRNGVSFVVDMQIVSDAPYARRFATLDEAHAHKVEKYLPIRRTVASHFPTSENTMAKITSATLSWRGVWSPSSLKTLRNAGLIDDKSARLIVCKVLLGSWIVFNNFRLQVGQ